MPNLLSRRSVIIGAACTLPFLAEAQSSSWRVVTDPTGDGWLNLRTGPGTRYGILTQLWNGRLLREREVRGNWSNVQDQSSGGIGWVYRPYTSALLGRYVVADPTGDGWLNFRAGPGTNHTVLRIVYNGDIVFAVQRQGNWMRVGHVGAGHPPTEGVGWVYAPYLKRA